VIYGGGGGPKVVDVGEHELELILRGAQRSSSVFRMTIEGDKATEQTMLRAVDRHPVSSRLVHLDFQRIDVNKPVEIEVPVHAVGSIPAGVRLGGILEHIQRTVTVRCKPLEMPARLDCDLSALEMHTTFHVSDMTLPAGIEVLDTPETALYTVAPPPTVKEPTAEEAPAAEGATAAEPEVIGRKKESAEES
jgi:large subunit ribosomal protein L25